MTRSPQYRSLLRSVYTAIIQTNLSPSELSLLANELRQGRLTDELAFMIDRTAKHFKSSEDSVFSTISTTNAEELIKRRKISKSSLVNIVQSIIGNSASIRANSLSTRQVLERFFDNASDAQAKTLIAALSSMSEPDPYLKGIAETRE